MAGNEKRPNGRTFRFLREIASGGFGSVYLTKVTHADGFSRILAVKLLHRRWSDNAEISRRMRDEARLLGWLRHRNIVDVADLTSIDGRTAILMEYLEAADLKEIVQHHRKSGKTVPVRCALEVMSAAASALDAAYNRPPYPGEKPLHVIHRDIKPSNIMVDDSGLVKVLDFGVARAEFEARESDTRELQFGSVDYMPPERLMFEPESPASDIYSLAATGFEIMSGEKLGKAKGSPARHNGNIIDRLSFLRAVVALPSGLADELEAFFTAALGFDELERPEASQVWARCKSLARNIGGLTLAEWSESKIPEIMKELNSAVPVTSQAMTGRELSEDSFMLATNKAAEVDAATEGKAVDPGDSRWSDLRNAAQAELDVLDNLGRSNETVALDMQIDKISEMPLALTGEDSPDDLFGGTEFEEETRIASSGEIDILRKRYEGEFTEDADFVEDTFTDGDGGDAGEIEDTVNELEDSEEAQVITAGTLLGYAATFSPQEPNGDGPDGSIGDAATRILSVDESAEIDDDGTRLMDVDEIEKPLFSVEFDQGMPAPFTAPQASLGAETILVGPSPEPFQSSSTSGLSHGGGGRRAVASFLMFGLALSAALAGGAYLFKDQLFGSQGSSPDITTVGDGPVPSVDLIDTVDDVEVTINEGNTGLDEQTAAGGGEQITGSVEPPDEPEPPAEIQAEGMVTFVSAIEPLRKMKVRCGSESQQGEISVTMPVEMAAAGCSVSIWPLSGGRQSTRVSAPSEGVYRCFEGGEGSCER